MIGDTLDGSHVMLTGVTGFLGKVYLAMLLDRFPEIGRITLLIRARGETALERFERIADTSPAFRPLKERHGAGYARFLGERIQVVQGDLSKPGCGLSDRDFRALSGLDALVHCAGLTDFEPDPKAALTTNTDGALRIAELAERLGSPLLHVSTAYVAGIRDGEVPESIEVGVSPNGTRFDPVVELAAAHKAIHKPRRTDRVDVAAERACAMGWPNIYTWSKGLAEHVLAARPGLKLTILRPSIVECAMDYPFPGWNEGLNTAGPLAWLISQAFRRLPARKDNRFDIVPVDYVARGMLLATAAAIRGQAPRVLHLSSSDVHPLRFERTIELTGLALRRHARKGGGTPRERRWFRHLDPVPGTSGWFAPAELRSWLPTLQEGLASLKERELPSRLASWVEDAHGHVRRAQTDVDRVEQMLRLYKPFIHDHDWSFDTSNIRALNALLPETEADLAFDVTMIDWCHYWVDVEYPGLQKWSIPILRGDTVPADPASSPALRLERADRERAASK